MDQNEVNLESKLILDRRQIIAGAAAIGLSAAFSSMPALAQATPKRAEH